ncbi:MAG: rRNA maturation RNase YbeY [Planctomycetota bacterium]|jgi:probable rRNA maturation factor
MDSANSHLHIQFDSNVSNLNADLLRFEELVREICKTFNVDNAAIEVSIVDDAGMIEVHREFLDKDNTTDVISFDLSDDLESGRTFQLVVNAEMAARQAAKRGHGAEAELALYITHGMLHNLGFDDTDPQQAKKMHETEDSLLQKQGFGIIYYKDELI